MVNQDNLAAPVLDGCVNPRGAAVVEDNVAAGVTADPDAPVGFVDLDCFATVTKCQTLTWRLPSDDVLVRIFIDRLVPAL